ncbi:insulin-like growth factor-binding protein complex acid labile subunit [Centruroides sculpturatus]|uniref:insulin-like growth factor-binding protein complex acid labile subunit n=1 Tax=Centruroides sculpturatus TaxID=218467 RepID=UPI000C6CE4AA|nr:insulin-like growth factor-binding protein complex acid labile subunit [Centruroides sculpturatus]
MKFLPIVGLLFAVAYTCEEISKKWNKYSCNLPKNHTDAEARCYRTKAMSTAHIINKFFSLSCANEPIDPTLVHCLEAKNMRYVDIKDCSLSDFDVGRFVSGVEVYDVFIIYTTNVRNFDSAKFRNIPSVKVIKLTGLRTDLLNITFENLPSLVSLDIVDHNFTRIFQTPFQHLTNLAVLSMKNGVLERLPVNLFRGLYNLKSLDLSYNLISQLLPSQFQNLSNLQYLDLTGNQVVYLPKLLLRYIPNLKGLYVDKNKLTRLPESLFAFCPKMNYFCICHNNITRIPSGIFKGLHELRFFNALNCSLTSLEEDLFSDARNLTSVILQKNKLQDLPSNLFKNNKNLKSFYVGGNRITSLPANFFHDLPQLEVLELSRNSLRNISSDIFYKLSSLQRLDLSHNFISCMPGNVFHPFINLQALDLSFNNFSAVTSEHCLGIITNVNQLILKNTGLRFWPHLNWSKNSFDFVDLSQNELESVTLPIFTRNTMKINLSQNNIRTIHLDTHKYGLNSPLYDIRDNNITCDCELRQFVHFLMNNEISLKMFPDIENLTCFGENRTLFPLWYTCPIKEKCPVDCECYLDYEGIVINCSGKHLNAIPDVLIEGSTIVDLRFNNISTIYGFESPTWKNVTHVYLNHNILKYFNNFPPNIILLGLAGNRLSHLPPLLMKHIDDANDFKIFLAGNNWTCGCDSLFTKEWLVRNKEKVIDFENVSCLIASDTFSFTQIASSDICVSVKGTFLAWKIVVIIVISVLLVLLLITAIIVYIRYGNKTNILKKSGTELDKPVFSFSYVTMSNEYINSALSK